MRSTVQTATWSRPPSICRCSATNCNVFGYGVVSQIQQVVVNCLGHAVCRSGRLQRRAITVRLGRRTMTRTRSPAGTCASFAMASRADPSMIPSCVLMVMHSTPDLIVAQGQQLAPQAPLLDGPEAPASPPLSRFPSSRSCPPVHRTCPVSTPGEYFCHKPPPQPHFRLAPPPPHPYAALRHGCQGPPRHAIKTVCQYRPSVRLPRDKERHGNGCETRPLRPPQ
jgi:hypothetical protein